MVYIKDVLTRRAIRRRKSGAQSSLTWSFPLNQEIVTNADPQWLVPVVRPSYPLFFPPERQPANPGGGWKFHRQGGREASEKSALRGNWGTTFENECVFSREYRRETVCCGLYLKCRRHISLPTPRRAGVPGPESPRTMAINRCIVPAYVVRFVPFFCFCLIPGPDGDRTGRFRRATGEDTFEISSCRVFVVQFVCLLPNNFHYWLPAGEDEG